MVDQFLSEELKFNW